MLTKYSQGKPNLLHLGRNAWSSETDVKIMFEKETPDFLYDLARRVYPGKLQNFFLRVKKGSTQQHIPNDLIVIALGRNHKLFYCLYIL